MAEPDGPMQISPLPSLLAAGGAFLGCLLWSFVTLALFGDPATTDAELVGQLAAKVGFVVAAAVATGTQLTRSRPRPLGGVTLGLAAAVGVVAPIALAILL